MAVNKVVLGPETLIDISSDTVTPGTLAEGVTAHNSDGELIVGEHTCDIPETVELAKPSLSVNKSTGEVTATVVQTSGGVVQAGSTKSEKLQLGVPRANTSMIVTANDSTDTISISAENKQSAGYVTDTDPKTASTSITLTVNGDTVTATATSGENVSKSVASVAQATPTVSVSGTSIVASCTQTPGYVKNGTTKTNSVSAKSLDSDLAEENIVKGVTIFGVTGTHECEKPESVERANTTISASSNDTTDKITITASNNQATGYVTGANKQASTVVSLTTSVSNGTITATATTDSNAGSKNVSKSVSDTYLKSENIKNGVTIFGVKGTYSGGTASSTVTYHNNKVFPSPACSSLAYYEIPLYYAKHNTFPDTGATFYVLIDLTRKKLAFSENARLQFLEPTIDFSSNSFNGIANGLLQISYTGTNLMFSITDSSKCEVDDPIVGFAV